MDVYDQKSMQADLLVHPTGEPEKRERNLSNDGQCSLIK